MQAENSNHRLSLIPTQWSLVWRAHEGPGELANPARQELLERYGCAVQRYLRKVMRNLDEADEVFQEFAVQLLHGDLRGADPKRGRFRNFVKGTLFHLIADHHKDKRRWPRPLPAGGAELVANSEDLASESQFLESWRDELMARAWAVLSEVEAKTDQPLYTVLRFRADHPDMRSPQIAEQLAIQLHRSFTSPAIRQILHRARQRFAEILLKEVRQSLDNPTVEQLELELVELNLLDYCRPALKQHALNV